MPCTFSLAFYTIVSSKLATANTTTKRKEKQMKKQNEKVNEVKVKKERKQRKFFLYVDGKGFVRLPRDTGSLPNFEDGEILCYTTRAKAIFARDFMQDIKLADSIDILSKVA